MRRKRSWRRIALGVTAVVIAAAALGAYVYIKNQQGALEERFRSYLTHRLSQSFGLQVEIGSITGDVLGTVALRNVSVSTPQTSNEPLKIFSCEEIRFRYTLVDFLRQNYTSWFDVILQKPIFYANAPFSANKSEGRSVEIFSGLAQHVRAKARLIIEDGTIAWLGREGTLSGIDGTIANRSYSLTVSLNHLKFGSFDATTTLAVEGQLVGDEGSRSLHLAGSAVTSGTVINWKPLPTESKLHFDLTRDALKIWDSEILGGVAVEGTIGHTTRQEVDLMFTAKEYPLKEIYDIFSFSGGQAIGGRMEGKLHVFGAVTEPHLVGECIIDGNDAPSARFKNLQLFFEGIYPQVKISRSQMILANGNAMQFASDQEINVLELFSSDTYERLIAQSAQRAVTWKEWTLYRDGDKDSIFLEHPLGDSGSVRGDEAGEGEGDEGGDEDGVSGIETIFGGKESLKVELKDDEQMFALQKKSQF